MSVHNLKIHPEYFEEVIKGKKTFESRRDDREPPYTAGDILHLQEYDGKKYTGQAVDVLVTHALRNGDFCKEGYVLMSIKPLMANPVYYDTEGFPHCPMCKSNRSLYDAWGWHNRYCGNCGTSLSLSWLEESEGKNDTNGS